MANQVYKGSINKIFDTSFLPIEKMLSEYGFQFSNARAAQCYTGEGIFYEKFSIEIPCEKTNNSNLLLNTAAFSEEWRNNSPQLERYLLSNGWNKVWHTQKPINKIYDKPENDGRSYYRNQGKINCELNIIYNNSALQQVYRTTQVHETCYRDVLIF